MQPELSLLIAAASVAGSEKQTGLPALLAGPLDWHGLLNAARAHGLMPLLASRLQSAGMSGVPAVAASALRSHWQHIAARNLWLAGELAVLAARLQERGIEAVAYKGPTLAVLAHGSLALREFLDLDLLIRVDDALLARELLISLGFHDERQISTGPISTGPISKRQLSAAMRSQYAFSLLRASPSLQVELHWNVVPRFFAGRFNPTEVWQRRQVMNLAGQAIPTLGVEDLLLVLCLHGAKHVWHRLAWISDVANLVARHPGLDWFAVVDRANRAALGRVLKLGLYLAHNLLAAPLPPPVLAMLAADSALPVLAAQIRNRLPRAPSGPAVGIERGRFHLRTRDTKLDRVRYCFDLATTPNNRDWDWLPLPQSLSPFYFLLRPVRLLGQYGRRLLGV